MTKKISILITEIAKEKGIDYSSVNSEVVQLYKDASRIGEIVTEFESLIDELDFILNRHKIRNGIKKQMEEDFKLLHSVDHDLIKIARKIRKEKK